MTRTAVKFPWFLLSKHTERQVEVEKVSYAPFYDTTYAVFVDGEKVGYVASRRERGHSTLWAYATTPSGLSGAFNSSRAMAVDHLLDSLDRKEA